MAILPHSSVSMELSAFDYYSDNNQDIYECAVETLSKDNCYFYFSKVCKEFLISIALEYFTFHPDDKQMHQKLNNFCAKIENIHLTRCTFPKEFKQTVQNVAAAFGMKMQSMETHTIKRVARKEQMKALNDSDRSFEELLFDMNPDATRKSSIRNDAVARIIPEEKERELVILFPPSPNILWFEGPREESQEQLLEQVDEIVRLGNWFQKAGVD